MIVLDTNTVAEVMRGDERVRERLLAHPRGAVTLPQPVVAEIEYGLARLPASRRRTALAGRWSVISRELRRIEWTDAVSARFGTIKAELERRGRPIDDFDVAIAAHAIAFEAVLVTHNLTHFERIPGLRVEDWLV
jgi:predicted nucleic acid-binding protein